MENLGKQAGYLKGLLEGAGIDAGSANGKLLAGIVEMLGALSERVEALDELMEDLNDYVESIDDDLTELEGGFDDEGDIDFGDDEDDEDDEDEEFDDQLHLLSPEDDEDDEDGGVISGKVCPECHRTFFVRGIGDDEALYRCPFCGERVRPADLSPETAPVVEPLEDDD